MSQQVDAIYDDGVFKPLSPLSLPDKVRVTLTVESQAQIEPTDRVINQKASLRKRWQELDQLPQTQNNDGWSVRQHDELLYGGNG